MRKPALRLLAAGWVIESMIAVTYTKGGDMEKDEFVAAVFEAATQDGLKIDVDRKGRKRIWFNPNSRKYLDEERIAALHPAILQPGIGSGEMNRLIESVAPGRPCTHVGMREIVERIR